MRLRRWLVPALAAVVAATALGAPATGAEGFVYRGRGCSEAVMVLFVDAATADPFVPEPFELRQAFGDQALVLVPAAKCRVSVDRSRPRPTIFSDVGIAIESPDGSPGSHIYMVWQASDNRLLARARRALGGRGVFSEATYDANGLVQARASFSWPANPYRLRVTTAGEVFQDEPRGNTWWQLGDRGPIRTTYRFSAGQSRDGEGTVRAQPGTPLARLLGGTRASGFGFIVEFDFTARVDLVSLN